LKDTDSIGELNKKYLKEDVINIIYKSNFLDNDRLKKIISLFQESKVIKISSDFLTSLIENDDTKKFRLILNHCIFDRNFIIKMLYHYKHHECMSDEQLKKSISNEINKINKDELNTAGNTPLIVACEKNNKDIVKILIKNGANINMKNQDGLTALFYACEKEKIEIAKLLFDNGADINKTSRYGDTPLLTACKKKNEVIAQYLIDKGDDIHKRNKSKNTCIILAIRYGCNNIVKELIERGVDLSITDRLGNTPLDTALSEMSRH